MQVCKPISIVLWEQSFSFWVHNNADALHSAIINVFVLLLLLMEDILLRFEKCFIISFQHRLSTTFYI